TARAVSQMVFSRGLPTSAAPPSATRATPRYSPRAWREVSGRVARATPTAAARSPAVSRTQRGHEWGRRSEVTDPIMLRPVGGAPRGRPEGSVVEVLGREPEHCRWCAPYSKVTDEGC